MERNDVYYFLQKSKKFGIPKLKLKTARSIAVNLFQLNNVPPSTAYLLTQVHVLPNKSYLSYPQTKQPI